MSDRLLRDIHNFIMRNFSRPPKKPAHGFDSGEDVVPIPEEKGKRLNWNVDYFASIPISQLKPEDVIVFRISDDMDLSVIDLARAKAELQRKAESYGIKNKVMVLYKVDIGVVQPDKELTNEGNESKANGS